MKAAVSAPPMYQLKVTLLGIDPEIWRRILVPPDINLGRLSRVIQSAMGWENCHCHEFVIAKVRYALPYDEPASAAWLASLIGGPRDERKFHLNKLVPDVARTFHYEYGSGIAKLSPGAKSSSRLKVSQARSLRDCEWQRRSV